jgi:hypothetical protein
MQTFYLGFSFGLTLAVCLFIATFARAPLQELVARRHRQRDLDESFAATSRQVRMEQWNRHREIYQSFRDATAGLVEAHADGSGRWSNFYLARDLLQDVAGTGSPETAIAAQQMCSLCQRMLNSTLTEELSVKFEQAVRRYDVACRDDLANLEKTSAPGNEDRTAAFDPESTDEFVGSHGSRVFKLFR